MVNQVLFFVYSHERIAIIFASEVDVGSALDFFTQAR